MRNEVGAEVWRSRVARGALLLAALLLAGGRASALEEGRAPLKVFEIVRDRATDQIVGLKVQPRAGEGPDEWCAQHAAAALNDGQALAFLSCIRTMEGTALPVLAVIDSGAPVAKVYCVTELPMLGTELLFPQWSASAVRLDARGLVVMVQGFGGDGGESWTSVAFVLTDSTCGFKMLRKETAQSECVFGEHEIASCSGRRLEGRVVSAGTAELRRFAVDGVDSERLETREPVDLPGLVSNARESWVRPTGRVPLKRP